MIDGCVIVEKHLARLLKRQKYNQKDGNDWKNFDV